jgi:hypothetical protein
VGGEACQTSQPPSHSPSLKTWEDHDIYLVFILGRGAHLKMYYGAGPVGVGSTCECDKLGRASYCSTAWCCVLQGHVLEPITPPLIHILGVFPTIDSHLGCVPHHWFTSWVCSPPLIHILGVFYRTQKTDGCLLVHWRKILKKMPS